MPAKKDRGAIRARGARPGGARCAAVVAAVAAVCAARTTRADGTATVTLDPPTVSRNWESRCVWTGDTGSQIFPGDGVGPGAGTEDAIARTILNTAQRSLNFTARTSVTIGSFTLQ